MAFTAVESLIDVVRTVDEADIAVVLKQDDTVVAGLDPVEGGCRRRVGVHLLGRWRSPHGGGFHRVPRCGCHSGFIAGGPGVSQFGSLLRASVAPVLVRGGRIQQPPNTRHHRGHQTARAVISGFALIDKPGLDPATMWSVGCGGSTASAASVTPERWIRWPPGVLVVGLGHATRLLRFAGPAQDVRGHDQARRWNADR